MHIHTIADYTNTILIKIRKCFSKIMLANIGYPFVKTYKHKRHLYFTIIQTLITNGLYI